MWKYQAPFHRFTLHQNVVYIISHMTTFVLIYGIKHYDYM
jgi:hypothetical protein